MENFKNRFGRQPFKKRDKLRITAHLTDHCNLNCAHCDHFAPLAPERFASAAAFEKDLKRLRALMGDKLNRIELLGGEPLLHPQLETMLDIAGKHFGHIKMLHLVTNGILLPDMGGSFWDACARNNVKVWMTNYPLGVPFEALKKKAARRGALLAYFDNSDAPKAMYNPRLDINGTRDPRESFMHCFKANDCPALEGGKLYPCSTAPYIKFFNRRFAVNLQVSDKDYIDIHAAKSADEVFEFLRKPAPFCRYCRTEGQAFDIGWGKSKKRMSEWT